MNRNVIDQMNSIIDLLKVNVGEEYEHLIVDVKRHIVGQSDDTTTIEFVKKAKEYYFHFDNSVFALYEYEEKQYLLLSKQYNIAIEELGLNIEEDLAINYGVGMLAIRSGELPLKSETTSLNIIERCLGIEPQNDGDDVVLEFSDICDMFEPYIVLCVDNSRFELLYEEDLFRLLAYILAACNTSFECSVNQMIQNIMLLQGSRSIAPSVVNFYKSPLIEYGFLQLYQCIEYIFKLNNCFSISDSYGVDVNSIIDIIKSYELKISETENLYRVLKNNASLTSIETFYDFLPGTKSEGDDKIRVVANYIYKLRCNIAHLRYDQDAILKGVNWEKCIEVLIDIIYSIYNKLDEKIVNVCLSKNSWRLIIL